jgi:hypothetical protein
MADPMTTDHEEIRRVPGGAGEDSLEPLTCGEDSTFFKLVRRDGS